MTAAEIAKQIGGEVIGNGAIQLNGFAPADSAKAGDLTFAENEEYFALAQKSGASAILVDGKYSSTSKVLIRVPKARLAFAKVLPLFFPERSYAPGIHPSAIVARTARIDPKAHIGPHCVIGEDVQIGAHSVLQAGNDIGDNCVIGEHVRLFPRV